MLSVLGKQKKRPTADRGRAFLFGGRLRSRAGSRGRKMCKKVLPWGQELVREQKRNAVKQESRILSLCQDLWFTETVTASGDAAD